MKQVVLSVMIMGLISSTPTKKKIVIGTKDLILALDETPVQSVHLSKGKSSTIVREITYTSKVKMQNYPAKVTTQHLNSAQNRVKIKDIHKGLQIFLHA